MFGKKAKRIRELEAQVAELVKENNILSGNVEVLQLKADAYDKTLQRVKEEHKKRSEAAKKAAVTRKQNKSKKE